MKERVFFDIGRGPCVGTIFIVVAIATIGRDIYLYNLSISVHSETSGIDVEPLFWYVRVFLITEIVEEDMSEIMRQIISSQHLIQEYEARTMAPFHHRNPKYFPFRLRYEGSFQSHHKP